PALPAKLRARSAATRRRPPVGAPRDGPGQGRPGAAGSRITHMTDSAAHRRLAAERTDYLAASLPDEAPEDPLALFATWLEEAFARRESHGAPSDPSAVVLSTVALGEDGAPRPRSRTVLLKDQDADGVVVYAELGSDKADGVAATRRAALLMPWYVLQRQVRIEGTVELLADADSDPYGAQRRRGSQLGAWASHHSREITSREALDAQFSEGTARFEGQPVPRPPLWGGLRIHPERPEFCQGRESRFHDRIADLCTAEGTWTRHRLQP